MLPACPGPENTTQYERDAIPSEQRLGLTHGR